MAGLRKGHCYTPMERPYTRKSKFKIKSYVKAVPTSKIVRYHMGDQKKQFTHIVHLYSKQPIQIRHNSLESGRQVVNKHLNNGLGNNYHFNILVYPHHVLRENKMITGAGADRMQTGMQKSFGRAIGIAAQIRKNQPLFRVYVDAQGVEIAKNSLKKAAHRLPGQYGIDVLPAAPAS